MTREEMRAEYERALERAEALGLRVAADGYTAEGTRVYFVPSSSDASVWHHVTVDRDGFHCSCSQGTTGHGAHYCTHRAAARQAWLQEEHALQQAEARQHEPKPAPKGKGYVVAYEPKPNRQTHCAGCGAAFTAGEQIVLIERKAFHVGCEPREPLPGVGADAPRRNTAKFNLMK